MASSPKVGTLEAIMVVCMVAGGPLWGLLADRCRAKKVGAFTKMYCSVYILTHMYTGI